ncbi:MAG: M23 family metallopeptidase [Pontixanthobacter sp.]
MRPWLIALAAPFLLAAGNAAGDPASETEHVVTEGETLGGIADRAGVPAAVIAAANGLIEPYAVRIGETLQIPRQRVHVVKDGDTRLGIANRYGVPFANIAIANGMDRPYTLRSGQRLIIPAVMTAKPAVRRAPRRTPYFRWPHDGPMLHRFSLRADGIGHDGVDLAAAPGDMVRASASGTVVFADSEPKRFGRLVVIDHGDGWRTRYGHLARMTVQLGDVVKTGERIGIAGDAGDATRTELHFEIMRNNKRIDPLTKLPKP